MPLIVNEDNTEEVVEAFGTAIERALEKIGLAAESYAKKECPVDTGRLRNSITHVVDSGDDSVAIGTNVEYGVYVHEGVLGRPGKPFLRDAATQHVDKYEAILKQELAS